MRTILLALLLASTRTSIAYGQAKKEYHVVTVAFYNVENLFDFENDPLTFDDDRTPDGKDHWTETMYRNKLENVAKIIAEIGADITETVPAIIGVCEIENRRVLEDLVSQKPLRNKEYGIIQFESPDRRGIDVALLYQKQLFSPTHYKAYPLYIYDAIETTKRVYTRDQLVVSGMLDGEKVHFIVNHWPSRRGGEARSRLKRIRAAQLNKRIIDSIFAIAPYAKIISMGDFNDDPTNVSIKKYLKAKRSKKEVQIKELYNPMERMHQKGLGTLAWRDSWNLFDQIIVSKEFTKNDYSSYRLYKAGIFNKSYLANPKGRFKGYPFRSFENGSFTGGYSDHFPVYAYFIKEKTSKR